MLLHYCTLIKRLSKIHTVNVSFRPTHSAISCSSLLIQPERRLKNAFCFSSAAASGNSSPVSMRSSSTLPVPQPSSASSTPTRTPGTWPEQEEEEERGDLIGFYNQVYIKKIRQFALRYSSSSPKTGVRDAFVLFCIILRDYHTLKND